MRDDSIDVALRKFADAAAEKDSAAKLAARAGLSPRIVARFLAGKRGLTLESAARLAEALKLRLARR